MKGELLILKEFFFLGGGGFYERDNLERKVIGGGRVVIQF